MNFAPAILISSAAAAFVLTIGAAPAPAVRLPVQTVATTFSDGAVAKTYNHCGDADLCATIDYPNGERLSFFSEGAAVDQPYVVHVVRTDAKGATIFEYSRRIDHRFHEQLTLDRGNVHLDVDTINDGTLHFAFNAVHPSENGS